MQPPKRFSPQEARAGLPLTDDELRAVGHVTVQWAILESIFDFQLQGIVGDALPSSPGERRLSVMDIPFDFSRRVQMAQDCLARAWYPIDPGLLDEFRHLCVELTSCRGKRDIFVHGTPSEIEWHGRKYRGFILSKPRSRKLFIPEIAGAEKIEAAAAKITSARVWLVQCGGRLLNARMRAFDDIVERQTRRIGNPATPHDPTAP